MLIREFSEPPTQEELKEMFKKIDEACKYMRTPPDKKIIRKIPVKKREKGGIA